jgi:thiol-disulfide isomerase/thioredoxin
MKLIAAAITLVLLVSSLAFSAVTVGKDVPEINAGSWYNNDGKAVNLADLKGKVTVVEFWATWCPPCRKSIPHLNKLHKKYKDKGVVIIGLSNEKSDTVQKFVKKQDMKYIVGAGSKSGTAYGVRGIPTAFVIGADGTLLWQGHPMNGLEKALEKAVKSVETATPTK